ncbi:MAG: hypothetical protein NVS2B7_40900 [Herpetosiphon sp.]
MSLLAVKTVLQLPSLLTLLPPDVALPPVSPQLPGTLLVSELPLMLMSPLIRVTP